MNVASFRADGNVLVESKTVLGKVAKYVRTVCEE